MSATKDSNEGAKLTPLDLSLLNRDLSLTESAQSNASVRKISIEELRNILNNPKTSEKDVEKYITIDQQQSGPFRIVYKPNPNTVDLPQAFAADPSWYGLRDAIAQFYVSIRNLMFTKKILQDYPGPFVVSEGDSWFMFGDRDIIQSLVMDYNVAIFGLESWGATLESMVNKAEYINAISEKNASFFLFSGGGNDILGQGHLGEYLREFDEKLSPSQHLLPTFEGLLDHVIALYEQMLSSVQALPVLTICHGYDYVVPNSDKYPSWLGRPMNDHGIVDRTFQASIAKAMIDRFNERLKSLVDMDSNAIYLDLRGIVGPTRWADEIHPTKAASFDIAARFKAEMDRWIASPS